MIKFAMVVCVWAVALSPAWAFLIARYLLAPEGFFQNLILFGVGAYLLGSIQFLTALLGMALTIMIVAGE